MRILTVTAGLGRGGSERAAQNFSTAYKALGHEVAVLAWKEDGFRRRQLEGAGIEVFDAIARREAALADADAFRPDIIHVHRVGIAQSAETSILRRLRRKERAVIETNIFGRADHSDAAALIDVHMHLSAWCLWRWQKWIRRDGRRPIGVIVPNPVDRDSFLPASPEETARLRSRLGVPADAYLCGRIGQPSMANWHPGLFHAFSHVATLDPKAYLLLVGLPDTLRPALQGLPGDVRARIVEMDLTQQDEKLSVAYSTLDCFIHAASFGESFGYVLTEAMLCECPVVTASTPHVNNSHVEVVGHLAGGMVAGSVNALPAAVAAFWAQPAFRARLRSRLREHVLNRFDSRCVAARAVEVATLALGSVSRKSLHRRVRESPHLQSHVSDEEIQRLLANTFGAPRRVEIAEMRLRHLAAVQRAVDWRLARRLERTATVA